MFREVIDQIDLNGSFDGETIIMRNELVHKLAPMAKNVSVRNVRIRKGYLRVTMTLTLGTFKQIIRITEISPTFGVNNPVNIVRVIFSSGCLIY